MGSVARAIQALEIALREAGHPLTNARPGGRDRSDLLDQAGHILGAPLPNELVELWEWWGGREFWPPEREPPGVWEDVLPGGVTILSLEEAKTQLDFFLEIELVRSDEVAGLLPFAWIGDGVQRCWVDTRDTEAAVCRVDLHYREHPPPQAPYCSFDSIASWLTAMTLMLETKRWANEGRGWRWVSNKRIWVTEAGEVAS